MIAVLATLAGCPKVNPAPLALDDITGQVLVTTVVKQHSQCSTPAGFVFGVLFVDQDTVVLTVGTNPPSEVQVKSWTYDKTSSNRAEIEVNWADGRWSKVSLKFETKTSGTYEVMGGPPAQCDPQDHNEGTFELKTPS